MGDTIMIDITKLDPTKTYVGYEVGTNKVAKKIQAICKRDAQKIFSHNKPKENEFATHVFSFVWNTDSNKWFIYESHFVYDGVRKYDYDAWLQMQKRDSAKQYFVFPFELSIPVLDFYEKYNLGYGCGHIEDLSIGEICQKGGLSWPNYPGVTSSEYLALCDVDYKVCNKFQILPQEVKPVHYQAYGVEVLGKEGLICGNN